PTTRMIRSSGCGPNKAAVHELPPHVSALRQGTRHAQASRVDAVARPPDETVGSASARRVIGERRATQHAVEALNDGSSVLFVPGWPVPRSRRIFFVAVLAPGPDVAVHVEQPQIVRPLLSHRPGPVRVVAQEPGVTW